MAMERLDEVGQWIFLVNPVAGDRSGQRSLRKMLATVEQARGPGRFSVVSTEERGHAKPLVHELAKQYGSDAVLFICGGDGTIHEAVNGLLAADNAPDTMSIVVLPYGTGNDFSRHLYGRLGPQEILDGLRRKAVPGPVDVIRAQGMYSVNVLSFGLDTRVQMINEKFAEKAAFLGESSFVLSSLAGILGQRKFRMGMEAESVDKDGVTGTIKDIFDYTLMAVCNGEYYGGGFHPAPGALSSDGILDICRVDPIPLPGILRLLPKYRNGTHTGHPAVHRHSVRKGTLYSLDDADPLLGNMDGEIFKSGRVDFSCVPGALTVYRLPQEETSSK